LRAAARLIVPCDHPRILTAPRYTIFLRDDAVSNRIHPINAPPGRCGCRRDDRHRGSKPSRGRSQGSRPFREYQPSTDGGWFPHHSGSSHGRSSPMDTRKCSTAVIAAKTPVTLWRQEMAPGFAPAPVLMSWQAATAVMLMQRLYPNLASPRSTSKVDERTIELRASMCRSDDENARRKGSGHPGQRSASCPLTPPSTTRSTPAAISFPPTRIENSERRYHRHDASGPRNRRGARNRSQNSSAKNAKPWPRSRHRGSGRD
jgi:hypothetical protein